MKLIGCSSDFFKISKDGTFAIEMYYSLYWCTEVVHQHWQQYNFYGKGTIFGDFLKITGISNQLHIWDLISTWIDICNAI